jgi:predicted nucleic acid-binding protein
MRWLLDTNIIIDAFAGKALAVKALTKARSDAAEWVGYSAITRLEVLGFAGLNAADDKGLRELLDQFDEASITSAVIEEAIRIRKSSRIKAPDAIISATAIVFRAELVTRNTTDFKAVPHLTVIDPMNL